jgi:hypothetical protein
MCDPRRPPLTRRISRRPAVIRTRTVAGSQRRGSYHADEGDHDEEEQHVHHIKHLYEFRRGPEDLRAAVSERVRANANPREEKSNPAKVEPAHLFGHELGDASLDGHENEQGDEAQHCKLLRV